jgi:hypothetical protein
VFFMLLFLRCGCCCLWLWLLLVLLQGGRHACSVRGTSDANRIVGKLEITQRVQQRCLPKNAYSALLRSTFMKGHHYSSTSRELVVAHADKPPWSGVLLAHMLSWRCQQAEDMEGVPPWLPHACTNSAKPHSPRQPPAAPPSPCHQASPCPFSSPSPASPASPSPSSAS